MKKNKYETYYGPERNVTLASDTHHKSKVNTLQHFGPGKGPKALRRCFWGGGCCYRFRKMPKALLISNGQL